MCCHQRSKVIESQTYKEAERINELRKRKSDLVFSFLRNIQEINRQIKLNQLTEEVARINRDYDKALTELIKKEIK